LSDSSFTSCTRTRSATLIARAPRRVRRRELSGLPPLSHEYR